MNTSMPYPFLLTHVSASQCIHLPGCVILGLQSLATKAASFPHLMAQRLNTINLLFCLVIITMYHKVSHFSIQEALIYL